LLLTSFHGCAASIAISVTACAPVNAKAPVEGGGDQVEGSGKHTHSYKAQFSDFLYTNITQAQLHTRTDYWHTFERILYGFTFWRRGTTFRAHRCMLAPICKDREKERECKRNKAKGSMQERDFVHERETKREIARAKDRACARPREHTQDSEGVRV